MPIEQIVESPTQKCVKTLNTAAMLLNQSNYELIEMDEFTVSYVSHLLAKATEEFNLIVSPPKPQVIESTEEQIDFVNEETENRAVVMVGDIESHDFAPLYLPKTRSRLAEENVPFPATVNLNSGRLIVVLQFYHNSVLRRISTQVIENDFEGAYHFIKRRYDNLTADMLDSKYGGSDGQ